MTEERSRQTLVIEVSSGISCAYHRKGLEKLPIDRIGPPGLCREIYYCLYPLSFSYVYGGRPAGASCVISCPKDRAVSFMVRRKAPPLERKIRNAIKSVIRRVKLLPQEIFDADIIPNQAYRCCAQDARFPFNIDGKLHYLCPAAFCSLFPHIFSDIAGSGSLTAKKSVACPDHRVNLQCVVTRPGEPGTPLPCGCYDFSTIEIRIQDLKTKGEVRLPIQQVLGSIAFPCFTAFQVLFPYYKTLKDGGSLGFYSDDTKSAVVQCPNIENKIEFLIRRRSDGALSYTVINAKGECPRGYKPHQEFVIVENKNISGYMLYIIYLYAVNLLSDKAITSCRITDPFGDGTVVYEIVKVRP